MRLGKDVLAMDLYGLLGVPRQATPAQVRRAYRIQAMTSHPDLHGRRAEHRMVELNTAAAVLLDPVRRAAYDQAREAMAQGGSARRNRTERAQWYPWVNTPSTGDSLDWIPPTPAPERPDAAAFAEARRLRVEPGRSLSSLLAWSQTWPPGTHAVVTFTSVCLALFLIASARPRSLPFLEDQKPLACATAEAGGFFAEF